MFRDLIRKRRSIRAYGMTPVSDEEERLLVEAALLAPTAKNRASVELITIRDKAKLAELADIKAQGGVFLKDADLGILVLGNTALAPDQFIQDTAIAATYILLQAEDLNLGACWVNFRGLKDKDGAPAEAAVRRTLGVPDDYSAECVIAVGEKNQIPGEKRGRQVSDFVHSESF
ncbi:nitroreductase family protein [Peptoniphilus equinus]|uniref:Nitroreductase family protein n=1 Tax=Peptoniphilus equinus TaxID=3016343 RepID=A0ABY7QTZ5_9FIRM|nr:nitroreductase family protein [Peptoniphilus equinus]WBW50202.1 nitroreductase family protein [Peptoniphilus equinus]